MSNNKKSMKLYTEDQVVTDYWFDKSMNVRKSIILYKHQDGMATPVMYLSKPRWISDEEFMEFFKRMQIYIAQ
jgi:hypothetical protein